MHSEVDIQQVDRSRREIAGDEYHRVRLFEPERQDYHDIREQNSARHEARPSNRAVYAEIADQRQKHGEREDRRYYKKRAAAADRLHLALISAREKRLALSPFNIGMVNARSAERAALLGVVKLNAAFYTIHFAQLLL